MNHPRHPRGITLTEILISILIMGVGITSLATLFPLGMIRLRDAQRYSRSGFLVESSTADLGSRNLLSKNSFLSYYASLGRDFPTYMPWPYDPWIQDTPSYGADPIKGTAFGAYRGNGSFNVNNPAPHNLPARTGFIAGPGLPVAYDPLWRYTTGIFIGDTTTEARFASGIGFVRPDPNAGSASSDASAHGLQRLTNFPSGTKINVPDIFVSPEDMVLQSDTDASKGVGASSPIVPDLNMVPKSAVTGLPAIQNDWKYTWMFTGRQLDCTNGSMFEGDIVIFENRPFAVDDATPPYTGKTIKVVAGEPVVEAIFGYTNNVRSAGGAAGYGSSANRAVLLRWPASMPDPEVKVGRWIADVTYERNADEDRQRAVTDPTSASAGAFYPYQRCHWYQVAKRTEAGPAVNSFAGDAAAMREMTVWTSTPLQSFTLLSSDGAPYHVNAALVSPFVVNVFPRTIHTR